MAPIRVALVGLSSSSKTSWAADAHLPYLLSSRGREHYELTALCNSSSDAARAAIEAFNLPKTTKSYGSPQELALDHEIDLVVVNTRVDMHYPVAVPSLKAGQAVWIEWPVAENVGKVRQLAALAQASGAKTVVGVQGQYSTVVTKVAELIGAGSIGKVVSANVRCLRSLFHAKGYPESLEYFTDIKVGGNIITVALGHVLDYVHSVLGEYATFTSRGQIQKPQVTLTGREGDRIVESDVPDYVVLSGQLQASEHVKEGATLLVDFRMEPVPFPGEPAFTWTIYGETGDLRITSPDGPFLHSSDTQNDRISIEVFDHQSGTVTQHSWKWLDWQLDLPQRARNVAEVYERFASGVPGSYPEIDRAITRHAEIDQILAPFFG